MNPSDALKADLKNKIQLVQLRLNWKENQIPDDPRKEMEVLENLQPSKHLKRLVIENYGGTQFPSKVFDNSLSNMVGLYLASCKFCVCLPTLGCLPFLKTLTIRRLDGIVSIDANFYGSSSSSFASLEELTFSHMKEWEEWECKAVRGSFSRLRCLHIEECPKLKGHLPNQLLCLKTLVISNCKQLVASAPKAPEITHLQLNDYGKVQFGYHPTTLKDLYIRGEIMDASSLETHWHIISNISLQHLGIHSSLNMNIPMPHSYDFLVSLYINSSWESLTTFPLDFFPILQWLELNSCPNLQMISQEHAHKHLKALTIDGCPQFESFPSEGLSAPSLKYFFISGLENLKSFPTHMLILLPSLDSLSITNCQTLESFPHEGLPLNLTSITLSNCYKLLTSLKGTVGANTSLNSLAIGNMDMESFPDEGLLPLSLQFLSIFECPNLNKLDYKGLYMLRSLKGLILDDNASLEYVLEEDLPKSISILEIQGGSPLLKQCFLEPKGKDRDKSAHIENVWVDDGNRIR